jgi:hypothetical protein
MTVDAATTAMPSDEERARTLFDEHAAAIAGAAVSHLKIHYPAALKAVGNSAERSLRNSIKAHIRSRLGPLLIVMTALEKTWTKTSRHPPMFPFDETRSREILQLRGAVRVDVRTGWRSKPASSRYRAGARSSVESEQDGAVAFPAEQEGVLLTLGRSLR